MSDLEVDRARHQAKVDQVLSLSKLAADYKKKHKERPKYLDLIEEFLKINHAQELLVPGNFPVEFLDPLRQKGFQIQYKHDPFFETRTVKTKEEIRAITKALRHTEAAVARAIQAIRKSVIRRGKL